jgi:indolepyruvate ferredoxin oxidoreductase
MERQSLADYEAALDLIAGRLDAANHRFAVSYAAYPEKIRGYGHVREANATAAGVDAAIRREAFLNGPKGVAQAAE